ncbi:DUF1275 family protein [Rhizobium calliandrae]|uniref:DUF1275 family protein n=1 Tax=Rhizobium calliandrae TaxID=1312182 RepID=A0ABT7KRB6_9HYPH|nr:DUF1275 family protein [Rhizobium calliandrae]MDL2409864.1 DUF1275 family protein [Rhizobium calliandrae]
MKPALPAMLSLNAGYVDTAGFLMLQGLFTAHVTGNFVTFGATVALGTTGIVAKLLALPMFCLVVIGSRYMAHGLDNIGLQPLRTMLALKLSLLIAGAVLAIRLGPFPNGDAWPALVTGMVLVSAMAIQNAVHRIHMASTPPTTLMTGTTTQIMIDLADLMRGVAPDAAGVITSRLTRMTANVIAFALGCGAAALAYVLVKDWCFVIPPVIALITMLMSGEQKKTDEKA